MGQYEFFALSLRSTPFAARAFYAFFSSSIGSAKTVDTSDSPHALALQSYRNRGSQPINQSTNQPTIYPPTKPIKRQAYISIKYNDLRIYQQTIDSINQIDATTNRPERY